MAAKKTTKTNRQPAKKPLPVKRSTTKKAAAAKTRKTSVSTAAKKRRRATPRKPAVQVKQFKLRLWKETFLVIQLQKPKKKKSAKKPASQSKAKQPFLPIALIIAGLIGTLYFTTDIFKSPEPLNLYAPPVPAEIEKTKPTTLAPKSLHESAPVRLRVPDIGIDTPLTTVGKNTDNTLEVPKDAQIPGWYRLSPTPGELGPAIIVGHVDSPNGPAIFWKLRQLTKDQIIEVTREDGSTARFKIISLQQFEQQNFPTNDVYGNINHAGLRLITCGGTFNRTTQSYSHNTVVYAELIP